MLSAIRSVVFKMRRQLVVPDRSPTVSFFLAAFQGVIGWLILSGTWDHAPVWLGGFMWWTCGVNCEKALGRNPHA